MALKGAEIKEIRRALLSWYRTGRRALPWRNTRDPFRIWISEVMLQQTRVATVIPYYQKFLQTFPDINSLARADLQAVLKVWEGLGYYARARHLHLARIRHGYTHFRIEADVFLCRHVKGRVRKKEHTAHRWVRPRDLDRFPFPGANRKFIPLIKAMDH